MRFLALASTALAAFSGLCTAQSTSGIEALVQRRLPNNVKSFSFSLTSAPTTYTTVNQTKPNDQYTVANGPNGTISISGNSPIALASGLRWYLTTYVLTVVAGG